MNIFKISCLLIAVSLMGHWSCELSIKDRLQKQMIKYPTEQSQIEKNQMLQYAINHNLDVKETKSGMYYTVTKQGNGSKLLRNQEGEITAHYVGRLAMNDEIFDSSLENDVPLTASLSKLIEGWQEAIPLLEKGGRGTFIIPSYLAYGDKRVSNIPPNSVLVFDIELLDFTRQ